MAVTLRKDAAASHPTTSRQARHHSFAIARSHARALGALAITAVLALSADAYGKGGKSSKKGKGDSSSASSDSTTATATSTIPLATLPVCLTEFTDDLRHFDELLAAYDGGHFKAAKVQNSTKAKKSPRVRDDAGSPGGDGAYAPYVSVDQALDAFAAHILSASSQADKDMCPGPLFDPIKDRLAFVFVDDLPAQPAVVRILQGTDPRPSPGSIRLLRDGFCNEVRPAPKNGVLSSAYPDNYQTGCSLFTIYLYRTHTSSDITTTYTATPAASPMQSNLSQAISTIATGASGFASPLAAAKSGKGTTTTESYVVIPPRDATLADKPTLEITLNGQLPLTRGEPGQSVDIEIKGGTPPYRLLDTACLANGLSTSSIGKTIKVTGTPTKLQARGRTECTIVDSGATPRHWGVTAIPVSNPMSLVTRTVISPEFDYAQVAAADNADLAKLFEPDAVQRRAQRKYSDKQSQALNSAFHDAAVRAAKQRKTDAARANAPRPDAPPATDSTAAFDALLRDARLNAGSLKEDEAAKAIYRLYTAANSASDPGADATAPVATTYTFGSRTFVTLGVGAGAIFKTHFNEPITVSSGTIADNQPSGVMTSVNLYLPLGGGYDESTLRPSWRERTPRFALGFVATPSVGGFAGFAFPVCLTGFLCTDFSRALSINAGYALMVTNVLSGTAKIGDPAVAGTNRRGAVGSWALQLGYGF